MPLSFPSSPALNQTFTYSGAVWTYDGKKWNKTGTGGGSATVTVSATVPSTTTQGSIWLDNDSGDLSVYQGTGWASVNSVGFTGSTGAQGPAGGYTGSASTVAGYTGSAGAGYTGSASTAVGYTGSTGAGYTGSAGAAGYAGSSSGGCVCMLCLYL